MIKFKQSCIYATAFYLMMFLGIHCTPKKDHKETRLNKVDSIINLEVDSSPTFPASFKAIHQLPHDSLKPKYLNRIAYLSRVSNYDQTFHIAMEESLKIAEKSQDSLFMGEVHWEYGIYYREKTINDSSYLHYDQAYKFFEKTKPYYAGKMLYNMAYVTSRIKDYTGSEVLIFRAIGIFKPLRKYKQLYLCHNLLGTIYHNLKEYDEALYHYEIALKHLEEFDDKQLFYEDIQNNIGVLYQHIGEQQKAIKYFDIALNHPDLKIKDAALYARIIDNKGYSKFLINGLAEIPWELEAGLRIRDSINNSAGRTMSHLHLSSYYLKNNDTVNALLHAQQAYELGEKLSLHRDALSALLLLAEIEPMKKEDYLKEFIYLNEYVGEHERKVRNKFTRIQFETENYIERNTKLQEERFYIICVSVGITLILLLIGITLKQSAKNRLLQLQAEERKAKEEILVLKVKKQENLVQGRRLERTRIAEELHDNILANLFGIRLSWEQIHVTGTRQALNKHNSFIAELQNLERRIRDLSHELSDNFFLTEKDFEYELESLFKKWATTGKFRYEIIIESNSKGIALDGYDQTNIIRIFEEALQNITKHAYSRNVVLNIEETEEGTNFVLKDDGIGFDYDKRDKGIGFKNMQSRMKKLKGILKIESKEGEGTKIILFIPKHKSHEN